MNQRLTTHLGSRYLPLALIVGVATPGFAHAQILLSHYKFDGDLTNESTFVDTNGAAAPDGTYRIGADSGTAVAGTPVFGSGVDGTPNGAVAFNGVDSWVDLTTTGHPGAPVALVGLDPAGGASGDPFANSGPGLATGTVMAWVKADAGIDLTRSQWFMGSANANTPPFIVDTQAFNLGWDIEPFSSAPPRLKSFARASENEFARFQVADPRTETSELEAWADGEWHHVAFRWNGNAEGGSDAPEFAAFFLDGVNLGAAETNHFFNGADKLQNDWQFPMAVGARNNRGTLEGFFEGMIDDLRVYSDFLSEQQIIDIYNELAPSQTDADADGDVDGNDYLLIQRSGPSLIPDWQATFGAGVNPLTAVTSIPEPTAGVLVLAGILSWSVARAPNRGPKWASGRRDSRPRRLIG